MPHAPPATYKTFAITIRPRDGATEDHDSIITTWLRKKCEYYYLVSEKLDADRHLHCGVFLKSPMTRSNFSNTVSRLFSSYLDTDEMRVFKRGVRIMYNFDFIQNYLDKDDDTEVILANLPEQGRLESFWPPSEEQAKARASAATDKHYAKLELLWNTHVPPGVECTPANCRNFLFDMMYSKRLIKVVRDDKTIIQTAKHLHRYVTKMSVSNVEIAPWEQ